MVPRELQNMVDRELEPGETVVWMDMPIPRCFTPASLGTFLFAIPWTAFAIFWICGASGFRIPDFSQGGAALFPLFGLPFVLVGLAMLSSPLWVRRKSLRTVYAITDRRAIVFEGGSKTTIRSFAPEDLREVYRREKQDRSGDVVIPRHATSGTVNDQQPEGFGFLNIRNPKEAERLLRALAQGAVPDPYGNPRQDRLT